MFKLVLKDGYEEALVINMIIEEIEKQKKQAADIESSVGNIGCAAIALRFAKSASRFLREC